MFFSEEEKIQGTRMVLKYLNGCDMKEVIINRLALNSKGRKVFTNLKVEF